MREVLLYFMTDIIKIIIAVVASAVVFGIVGFLLGQMHRKRVAEDRKSTRLNSSHAT